MSLIVLASSSPYRKQLLERLDISFETFSPNIDEDLPIQSHIELVNTLSLQKAQAAQKVFPDAICIGCDTMAALGTEQLGKPGSFEKAVAQLKKMSGQTVEFYSGIAVVPPNQSPLVECIITKVQFKALNQNLIENYLHKEQPYQSCGSFKSETSAIALIDKCQSDDPTAIIGLPLICLTQMLNKLGIPVI